jgi:hypothetical protein
LPDGGDHRKGKAAGSSKQPAARQSKAHPKSALAFLWSVGGNSGLIDEKTQSGWWLIVESGKIL